MKNVIFTTVLLLFCVSLPAQSATIEIRGRLLLSDLNKWIQYGDCGVSASDYPSPMAIKVVRRFLDDLKTYRGTPVTGLEGYDDKVRWVVSPYAEVVTPTSEVAISITTDSEWLGNLVGRYLTTYSKDICLHWQILTKTYPVSGKVTTVVLATEYVPRSFDDTTPRDRTPTYGNGTPVNTPTTSPYGPSPATSPNQPVTTGGSGNPENRNAVMLPTARYVLPSYLFRNISNVGDANFLLSSALRNRKFHNLRYFAYDNGGFEIFTQLEAIDKATYVHLRWVNPIHSSFSFNHLVETVRNLLFEDRGFYRMLVLKYDPEETHYYDSRRETTKSFQNTYTMGSTSLSSEHARKRLAFSSQEISKISFLVYEFEYAADADDVRLLLGKNYHIARRHLESTGLWQELHRLTDSRP